MLLRPGPQGVPLLTECDKWFAGRILQTIDAGDHVGFLLEPIGGQSGPEPALGFQAAKDIEPGHAPDYWRPTKILGAV